MSDIVPEVSPTVPESGAVPGESGMRQEIKPQTITQKMINEFKWWKFTVRRPLIKACGHKYNPESDPRTNCPSCWFAFFQNGGQMTQIADECFTEAGRDVLERSRGKKFVRFFLTFMSTIARFQREAAETQAAEAEKETNGEELKIDSANYRADYRADAIGPASDTSIGGLAGETQSIGGIQSDTGSNNQSTEDPVNEGPVEGLGISIG